MSVDVWVFARSLPPQGSAVRQAIYDSQAQFGLFLQNGGVACAASTAMDSTYRVTSNGLPLDAWTHVACTLAPDDEGIILYLNGVEAARAVHDGVLQASLGDIYIAANSPTGTEQLDGVVDELRIFRARRGANDVCWSAQP